MATIQLVRAVRADKGLSHQTCAWNWLQEQLSPEVLAEFANLFRADPPDKTPAPDRGRQLAVPYFSQRDSAVAGQAARMCFSSSCAMLVAFLKPGVLSGANADDTYLRQVQRYGDTTSAAAQLQALKHYGIKARFSQKTSFEDLIRQIERGVPVPCGFLHHGTPGAPTGGGHWLIVTGYTADRKAVIVNDPWGEADLPSGRYINTNGKGLNYSRKNWGPRFEVEGPGSGWAILVDP